MLSHLKVSRRLLHFGRTLLGMDTIQDVDIDGDGRFKYILIKVEDKSCYDSKMIVRGYGDCGYHADIFDRVEPTIRDAGLDCDCVGGGRIIHSPLEKKLSVFGYSTGYGKADHSQTVDILKTKYPGYSITFSDEGY